VKSSAPSLQKYYGNIALLGVCTFLFVGLTVQGLRTDLDWQRAPLSFYLVGTYGGWLQASYIALSASMWVLGIGFQRVLVQSARSGAPALLFIIAGVALAVTAFARTGLPGDPPAFEAFVHNIAAQTTFLCVTTAMLLQAWWLRRDPHWQARFAFAFALAVFTFVALWIHVLWRDAPRGLTQKAVILLILFWLALASLWLRRYKRLAE
jgi:hypothetical protein